MSETADTLRQSLTASHPLWNPTTPALDRIAVTLDSIEVDTTRIAAALEQIAASQPTLRALVEAIAIQSQCLVELTGAVARLARERERGPQVVTLHETNGKAFAVWVGPGTYYEAISERGEGYIHGARTYFQAPGELHFRVTETPDEIAALIRGEGATS